MTIGEALTARVERRMRVNGQIKQVDIVKEIMRAIRLWSSVSSFAHPVPSIYWAHVEPDVKR